MEKFVGGLTRFGTLPELEQPIMKLVIGGG